MTARPTSEPTTCPGWCMEETIHLGDGVVFRHDQVVHTRPLLEVEGVMSLELTWTQDMSPVDDHEHFYEPPTLAIYGGDANFLPATPDVLEALRAGAESASMLLMTSPDDREHPEPGGYLERMDPVAKSRFLAATLEFLTLMPRLRSDLSLAQLEHEVRGDTSDPWAAAAYFRGLADGFRRQASASEDAGLLLDRAADLLDQEFPPTEGEQR